MNLIQDIRYYNNKHIYFTKKVENTVLNNSYFSKIIFSDENVMLSGVFFYIQFVNFSIEKHDNKQKCIFDIKTNKNLLDYLINIESVILNKYSCEKNKKYLMKEQIEKKFIRIYNDNYHSMKKNNDKNNNIILKISGIWENINEIGITFKFLHV